MKRQGNLLFVRVAVLALSLTILVPGCRKKPKAPVREVIFEVYAGESTRQIAARLDSLGIISRPRRFITRARIRGIDRTLQSGVYRLHTAMTEDSVLAVLVSGAIATTTVTIPEGYTLEKIADKLAEAGVVDRDSFVELCKSKELLSEYNVPFKSLEGVLFPDTYKFPVGISSERVVRMMVNRFFDVTEPLLDDISLDSLVIMASIVEREAFLDEERPIVASVFWNRLNKGMALESCATVEYALPEHKERLTYYDLRIESPYNTYINQGLPPGPICSPGKAALEAAAHPAKTEYLFFVSKGDGSHHFSRTAAEHERVKRDINSTK